MKREIDLHGMTVVEAKWELVSFLNACSAAVTEVEVIHGFHGGKALQTMVRKEFSHPKLKKKILGLNGGVTIFLLKDSPKK